MKYVLTGGPGIGKTTVIEILAARGYEVVPEAARMIVEEQKAESGNVFPWTDLRKFQEKVAERQIQLEEKAQRPPIFLDRGLIDGYGYSILGQVDPPEIIEEKGFKRYEKVFILEPLNIYINDHVRTEDRVEARRIHDAIINAYKRFNYEIIAIPVLSPEERVEEILRMTE